MARTALACLLLTSAGVCLAAAPSQEPSPRSAPSPQQIFVRAFERLRSYPIPAYALYTTTWAIRRTDADGTTTYGDRIRYAVRTGDELENAAQLPIEDDRLPKAGVVTGFLGPSAWTLRAAGPASSSPSFLADMEAPLKTIADVAVRAPPIYAIDLAGIESIQGHRTYHLRLRPRVDEMRHNL
ncbi:MAG: hypothetical protein WB615_04655, partial [Candidatus Tumulicola sp.]